MPEQFVYGIHAVSALFSNTIRKITKLYIHQERKDQKIETICKKALVLNIPIEKCPLQTMNTLFADCVHQGLVAVASPLPQYHEADLPFLLSKSKKPACILILDGITDPHNLGACLRTAYAAGVDFVIIPKDKSAGITPVVSKVACGAVEWLPVVKVTNLVRAMELLKEQGIWIYGAESEAERCLYQMTAKDAIAVVMGAEGKGLRRLTKDHCDGLFSIPMHGQMESLNVSVATGVVLYELFRQRKGDP
jgi:23S rRNA (guanosine2251-2'-O)-methyltransferase